MQQLETLCCRAPALSRGWFRQFMNLEIGCRGPFHPLATPLVLSYLDPHLSSPSSAIQQELWALTPPDHTLATSTAWIPQLRECFKAPIFTPCPILPSVMGQHPEELLLIHVSDNFLETDFNFNVSHFCLAQDSQSLFCVFLLPL